MPNLLRIHFTGLCLFAPEHSGGEGVGKMHVLFPATTGGGHDHAHGGTPHIAKLVFDRAHLRPGNTEEADTPATLPLDHAVLTVPGNEANLSLCRQIVNLRDVGGEVDPDQLRADEAKKLGGRATLGKGSNDAVEAGRCWKWNGEVRPMTHRVQWTVPFEEGSFTLRREGLHGRGENRFLELHPINREINVMIYHLPRGQSPWDDDTGGRERGKTPDHFASLYSTLATYSHLAFPEYHSEDGCGAAEYDCEPVGGTSKLARWGGTPFNCMGGGVYP